MKLKSVFVIIAFVIVTLVLAGFLYYKIILAHARTIIWDEGTGQSVQAKPPTTPTPNYIEHTQITKLTANLELYKKTSPSASDGVYYEAGTIASGKYHGYKRIVGIQSRYGTAISTAYEFATNDDKTYVLDGNNELLLQTDSPKVISADTVDPKFQQVIKLDNTFGLYRDKILIDKVPTNNKDSQGNTIYENVLVTDLSNLNKLSSPVADLSIYGNVTDTKMVVQDSSGLAYVYNLAFMNSIYGYPTKLQAYTNATNLYNQQVLQGAKNAMPPTRVLLPHLDITGAAIYAAEDHYKNYDVAIPTACATEAYTKLALNYPAYNLTSFGWVNNIQLFVPKDTNDMWNWDSYNAKINQVAVSDEKSFDTLNGVPRPTFSDYTAKSPVLFFRDYWGRLVVDSEADYKLAGGCGKAE